MLFDHDGLYWIGQQVLEALKEMTPARITKITGVSGPAISGLAGMDPAAYQPTSSSILRIAAVIKNPKTGEMFQPWELFSVATGRVLTGQALTNQFDFGGFLEFVKRQTDPVFLINCRLRLTQAIEDRIEVLENRALSPLATLIRDQALERPSMKPVTRAAFAKQCGCSLAEINLIMDGENAPIPDDLWDKAAVGLSKYIDGWRGDMLRAIDSARISKAVESHELTF